MMDSRVTDIKKRGNVQSKAGQLTPAYCVICHKPEGYVTEEGTGLVIVVCDDCHFTHGAPPGLQELWDEEVQRFIRTGKHN